MGSASEHTPLITTVKVDAAPQPRRRYSHPVVRRFCTLSFSSILLWVSLLSFASFTFTLLPRPSSWPGCGHGRSKVDYKQLRQLLLDTPSSKKAEEWQRYYTAGPHLAGKNYSQVCWPGSETRKQYPNLSHRHSGQRKSGKSLALNLILSITMCTSTTQSTTDWHS